MSDLPIDSPGDDAEREARAFDFSRRALLRAGWAVPVVLTLAPTAAFAQSPGPHSDAHQDDHVDTHQDDHVDGHSDAHVDDHSDAHADAPHVDSDLNHVDIPHNDTAVVQINLELPVIGHADFDVLDHEDVTHGDSGGHSDTLHTDHTDIIGVNVLNSGVIVNVVDHDDVHGDHDDVTSHGDVPHADSP